MHTPSKYQQALFHEIQTGTRHVVVEAVAGSGKTTTLVHAVNHVPPNKRVLMCAFNTAIQQELSKRIVRGAEVKTLHSLGYSIIRRAWGGKVGVDAAKDRKVLRQSINSVGKAIGKNLERELPYEDIRKIGKVISKAKENLLVQDIDIARLCAGVGLVFQSVFGHIVRQAITLSIEPSSTVSFDDMIAVPLFSNLVSPQYDIIFVDETQDLNNAQWHMIRRSVFPNGRIIAVGDRFQTIYGFRGARTNGIESAIKELDAVTLPLPICYRCPPEVVDLAKKYVPQIEAAPDKENGTVVEVSHDDFWKQVQEGDLVLSRINSALVTMCLRAFKKGIKARAIGRDLGKDLTDLVGQSKATDVPDLMRWLDQFEEHEEQRLKAAEREEFLENTRDRIESVRCLSEGLSDIPSLLQRIEQICVDDDCPDALRFSSVHRAKGLEEDRVWVLTGTFFFNKSQEEDNLYYVAITRAKKFLGLILPTPEDH